MTVATLFDSIENRQTPRSRGNIAKKVKKLQFNIKNSKCQSIPIFKDDFDVDDDDDDHSSLFGYPPMSGALCA